jgi:hypothetical protein
MKVFLSAAAAEQHSHGSVSHPTEGGIHGVIARLPYFSCFFAACAIVLSLLKSKLKEFGLGIPTEWPEIRKSRRNFFPSGVETRAEVAGVLTVFVIGVVLRLWHLGRPVHL